MIAVTYRITLLEPLLATSLQGDPNSAISFDYLPGSLIRGAVAGRLAATTVDLASQQRDLIFNGAVRYLNAYPCWNNETGRRLPSPASWKVEKAEASKNDAIVYDFAQLSPEERTELGQVKDRAGFTPVVDSDQSRYQPTRQVTVHTLRDRTAGRATRDGFGAVYRYDAIAQGETFLGAIVTTDLELAKEVQQLLGDDVLYLGGAQRGGYGKVQISDVMLDEQWSEYPDPAKDVAAGESVRITLLSDAILRDRHGVTTLDLVDALALPVKSAESFRRSITVGGFNRKWGLPLPQEFAAQAGSVYVFKATDAIPAAEFQRLLDEGIGERRAEGFGRIAINWGGANRFTSPLRRTTKQRRRLDQIDLGEDALQMAQRMERRLQRQALDKALIRTIQEHDLQGGLANSQLSRLRIIARSALAEAHAAEAEGGTLLRVAQLFDTDNPNAFRRSALNKLNRVRVQTLGKSTTRLPAWIDGLARRPDSVWQLMGSPPARRLISTEEEAQPPLTLELAQEYAIRLIDGVLGAAMKKNSVED